MTSHLVREHLTVEDFDRLMGSTFVQFPWALAVSGGSDSIALMILSAAWARAYDRPQPIVLTVDHGLRAAAAEEAQQVTEWATAHGLRSQILRWTNSKSERNVQSTAREARFRLLGCYCLDHKIRSLALAHTQDDQAETVLLRLARGSGVDGLSSMRAVGTLPLTDPQFAAIRLLRPLLSITRGTLRATLEIAGQQWLEDPSNEDPRFARVRMRKAIALLSKEAINPARLAKTAALMDRARLALDHGALALRQRIVRFDNSGYAELNAAPLLDAPTELGLRVLADVLQNVGGSAYRPRLSRLERLYNALCQDVGSNADVMSRGVTLAGCRIVKTPSTGIYFIVREMAGLRARVREQAGSMGLRFGGRVFWDNRFEVTLAGPQESAPDWHAEVRPLGRSGLAQAKVIEKETGTVVTGLLPAPVLPTLPALWVGDRLVAAPHLGLMDKAQFPKGIDSHSALTARFLIHAAQGMSHETKLLGVG